MESAPEFSPQKRGVNLKSGGIFGGIGYSYDSKKYFNTIACNHYSVETAPSNELRALSRRTRELVSTRVFSSPVVRAAVRIVEPRPGAQKPVQNTPSKFASNPFCAVTAGDHGRTPGVASLPRDFLPVLVFRRSLDSLSVRCRDKWHNADRVRFPRSHGSEHDSDTTIDGSRNTKEYPLLDIETENSHRLAKPRTCAKSPRSGSGLNIPAMVLDL